MIFLGGVFMPVDSLPPALRVVARALPLTYTVEALRTALGGAGAGRPGLDLLALLAFTVGLYLATAAILARRAA